MRLSFLGGVELVSAFSTESLSLVSAFTTWTVASRIASLGLAGASAPLPFDPLPACASSELEDSVALRLLKAGAGKIPAYKDALKTMQATRDEILPPGMTITGGVDESAQQPADLDGRVDMLLEAYKQRRGSLPSDGKA